MAVTQANIDYLEARHAEFWIPTSSSSAVLKKATVGAEPNPRNPSRWEIRLKDGYKFVSMPQMRFLWVSKWVAFYDMTEIYEVGDEQRAFVNRNSTGVADVDFNFEVQQTAALYEINQNDLDLLTDQHVTMKVNNLAVALGTKISPTSTVTLTVNEGFILEQAYFWDEYNNLSYFTIENNIGTFTPYDNTPLTGFTVSAIDNTPEKFKCFTVTQAFLNKLSSAKLLVNNVEVVLGQDVFQGDNLKLQANEGYYFGSGISLISAYNDYQYDLYFSVGGGQNPTTATATLLYPEVYNDIIFQVYPLVDPDPVDPDPVDPDPVDPDPVDPDPEEPEEPEQPKYPEFTYNEDMKAIIDDNHTKFYSNGVILNLGDIVYSGDLLEIKCNSGYVFSGNVKFIAYDIYNYTNDILFSINASGTIATYTVNTDYYISSLELLTEQTDAIVGSGNIFKITEFQLQQINKDRFYATPAPNVEIIDYGTNILGVIKLPFDISSDHIQNDELIRLGSHITTVSAPKIDTDKLVLDLGDIEVQAPSNLLDYSNTRVLLHLPYAPTMSLDIDYVLGYTINVEYIINLYDGNSTINIKSSKTNKIIASGTVDLGVNIPYSSDSGYSPASNNTNVMMGGDNHVKSPFIEINRNIPLLADKFFTIPVIDESTLMGNIGFVRVDEIDLNVSATSREKELIISALKAGVIIK